MFTRALRARRAVSRLLVPGTVPPIRYLTASALRRSGQAMAEQVAPGYGGVHSFPDLQHASELPLDRLGSTDSDTLPMEHSTTSSRRAPLTILPTPLPPDMPSSSSHQIHYPSSASHSSLSLIEVCLRKPETTDRAYSIFASLVKEHEAGRAGLPPAEAWGSVIEGCGAMGADYIHMPEGASAGGSKTQESELDAPTVKKMTMWRRRAEGIVNKWESVAVRNWRADKGLPPLDSATSPSGDAEARSSSWQGPIRGSDLMRDVVLEKDGAKIYQGWLRGCLHSKADLSTLLTHMDLLRIPLDRLLPAFNPEERMIVFETLGSTARRLGRDDLEREVRIMREEDERQQAKMFGGDEEEGRVSAADEELEIKPIVGTAPTTEPMIARAREAGESEDEADLPRFAVINLRAALRGLKESRGKDPVTRQQLLEAASLAAARAELEHAAALVEQQNLSTVKDAQRLSDHKLQAWMHEWSKVLTKKIQSTVAGLSASKAQADLKQSKANPSYSPAKRSKDKYERDSDLLLYLRLLPPDKLALITILEVTRLSGSGGIGDGMKTARALMTVGKAIETEYRAGALRDVIGIGSKNWLRDLNASQEGSVRIRSEGAQQVDYIWNRLGQVIAANEGVEKWEVESALASSPHGTSSSGEKARRNESLIQAMQSVWMPTWSQATHVALGSILVHALIETAMVKRYAVDADGVEHSELQPAFVHSYEYVYGRKLGVITLNPEVAKRTASDGISMVLHPKHLPMLVKPRPWRAWNSGGYLFHTVSAMRYKDSPEQAAYMRSASDEGKLDKVFAGMDVLSGTAWRINEKVFDVMLESWNAGQAIADVPAAPENADYPVPQREVHDGPEERARYLQAMRNYTTQVRKDHGERCKYNYNLEIAKAYLRDEFYIPHNLDFRGRAYPIPPHLSPVGDDFSRGLLRFSEKKALGARGLMWLKIHLANLCGFDKASFSDRAQYAEVHLEDIFDSADKPLDGRRWWLSADDPWQCLATCFELTAALRSGDPLAYESSLPVHQDGTCNGMQHYAALGGDPQGAAAVNLDAGDRPSDVYTNIADLVSAVVDQDAARGVPLATLLQGKIGRKVVKQTVMTTVYGVTFIGAKDQIARQLKDRGDIPADDVYHASGYVARTVLSSIGTLFGGAKAIQDWLTLSARLISNSFTEERVPRSQDAIYKHAGTGKEELVLSERGEPMTRASLEQMSAVIWTTPLGLPVVQPYRKKTPKQTTTALQTIFISDPNAISEVSPTKQSSGLPPNFIHSLDATHMMMTADRCSKDGITFASVHDSYWSHASSIDGMSAHIREAFIELHSADIIGTLRQEFIERYKDNWIPRRSALALSNRFYANQADLMPPALQIESRGGVRGKSNNATPRRGKEAMMDHVEADEDADALFDVGSTLVEAGEVDAGIMNDVDADARGESESESDEDENSPTEVRFNGKQFHRLSDCIPACPPRGTFDVNRIRLSPYFFS